MNETLSRMDIQNVVVILAGSRTGSSFLFKTLCSQADFLAPTGEETVFYRQAGLGRFHGMSYSDAITHIPENPVLDRYFEALRQDVGLNCARPLGLSDFPTFWHRLGLQWPQSDSKKLKLKAQELYEITLSSAPNSPEWSSVYLSWIENLAAHGFPVSTTLFSAASTHPRNLTGLEEPPFVTPRAYAPLTRELLSQAPLLLKTSTTIYRLPFLRALFPNAQFRWIALKRNPLATISALMDGWLSTAFHSHDVSPHAQLSIDGYSDKVPGGDRYWKFDMPPGWEKYTASPLEDVCAFQWSSAYEHMDRFLSSTSDAKLEVSYEDLLANTQSTLTALESFCGARKKSSSTLDMQTPVASVSPPQAGKWKKRALHILPLIEKHNHGQILKLAKRFDYDVEAPETWI